jgi:hypothetical protein
MPAMVTTLALATLFIGCLSLSGIQAIADSHQSVKTRNQGAVPVARPGTFAWSSTFERQQPRYSAEPIMNNVIYLVGLVVIVLAVLAFFGLR